MASISIFGDTSGSITLAAPAVAGTTTLTLPTTNGTVLTSGSSLSATQLTGTVGVANGGTGQTTYTDGQLLIGNSTGNTLTKATLTAGSGITVTNGSGSITIAASGGGGLGGGQLFTTVGTSTWVAPAGVTKVKSCMTGGGGGGGRTNQGDQDGGPGGNSGYAMAITTVVPGTTYNVVVGAGGARATGYNSSGQAGTASSFNGVTATGGGGGGGNGGAPGSSGTGSGTGSYITTTGTAGNIYPNLPGSYGYGGSGGPGSQLGNNGGQGYVLLEW